MCVRRRCEEEKIYVGNAVSTKAWKICVTTGAKKIANIAKMGLVFLEQ